jgi:hypothetical protein
MYEYKVVLESGEQVLTADAYEFRGGSKSGDGWLTFFEFSKEMQKEEEKKIVTATWSFKESDVIRVEIES